jgi:excisionase family DNA binding protein
MNELPRVGEKLLTVKDVADMLGVSTLWVYEHARGKHRPKLPCVRMGHCVRFRPSSIEEFVRALEQGQVA